MIREAGIAAEAAGSTPRPVAALLTARGRGAVSTIGFRGDVARIDEADLFRAENGKSVAGQPAGRVAFGRWGHEPEEEVVVCRVAADTVEIHCHGGEAAAERILSRLKTIGAERIDWREFTGRVEGAFERDIAEALSAATTARTAAIIVRQSQGPLREALRCLAASDPAREQEEVLGRLEALLKWANFGSHLTRPWRVVLYGRPNAGKSSLINALVGFERAIVFDQPGTTRDVVTVETAFDGWPVRLSDTAGLRADAGALEAAGIERAKAELAEADLRVLVEDRSRPAAPGDDLREETAGAGPHLIVLSKCDLPDARRERSSPNGIAASARTGEGVRELMARITRELVPEVPVDDEAVPISKRQIDVLRSARSLITDGDYDGFLRTMREISS